MKILKRLTRDAIVLDLGAGAGIVSQMDFCNLARKICGVDPDQRVLIKRYPDESKVVAGEVMPYPAASFDLVFSDNVLEHLEAPAIIFKEVPRAIKPKGLFLVKTPNRRHYMPLIARMTPHRFHQYINRKRGRDNIDTFPTRYRINTPADIARYGAQTGLKIDSIRLIEDRPEYLRITSMTYLIARIYERIVNLSWVFEPFRIVMLPFYGNLIVKQGSF